MIRSIEWQALCQEMKGLIDTQDKEIERLNMELSEARKRVIDTIKDEIINRLNVTNTLPEQQRALKQMLEWMLLQEERI